MPLVILVMYMFNIPDRVVLWIVLNWTILRKVIKSALAEEALPEEEVQDMLKPGLMTRMKSILSRLSMSKGKKKKVD